MGKFTKSITHGFQGLSPTAILSDPKEALLSPITAGTLKTPLGQALTDRPDLPDAPSLPPEEEEEEVGQVIPDPDDPLAKKRRQKAAALKSSAGGRSATVLTDQRPTGGTLG